jgi:prephenate dehydratase
VSAPADAAYQGTTGAFSEDAARGMLGDHARLQPCPTLDEVFTAVSNAHARYAVVPIENTLAGAVPGCADLLSRHPVRIIAERIQPIAHALIAAPGTTLSGVRRVLSHPVALAQCERFFAAHRDLQPVPTFDTAGAVAEVMTDGRTDTAAIASLRAAAVHGGDILAENIQDFAGNFTRFLLLQRGEANEPLRAGLKTSVICVLPNEPGSLLRALAPFAALELNLSRIESRPIREAPFEYQFHLDVGPCDEAVRLGKAMTRLHARSRVVRILGQYEPAPHPSS